MLCYIIFILVSIPSIISFIIYHLKFKNKIGSLLKTSHRRVKITFYLTYYWQLYDLWSDCGMDIAIKNYLSFSFSNFYIYLGNF